MADPEFFTQPVPTAYFFGVTTEKSSSRRMFPLWADLLDLGDAQLTGVNLPINGPADAYRRAVAQIKHDPLSRGAVITTHKINTLSAARDLFDELTPDSTITGEISAIYKRGGCLIGHTVDPTTSGQAMARFIPPGYWQRSGAHILCLGAGGSAVALAAHLTRGQDRPARVTFVNRTAPRLAALQRLITNRLPATDITFAYVENSDPAVNDALMRDLPARSLVINATGMGKDSPGSPITDAAVFPRDGFAWELNYRGELDFMHQALAQTTKRNLTVVDGWDYFLLGWSTIIGLIFEVEITPDRYDRLAEAAASIR